MSSHAKSWIILRACSVALIALALTNVSAASALHSTKKRQTRQQPAARTPAPRASLTQTSTTRWKNQRGSTLVLIKDANGNLTGEFKTAVGCGVNKPRKLFGTTNGSGLAFTVNFEECTSIGSWTGQMESPTEIRTLWLLTVDSGDPKSFKATYAGSDVFTLVP
jgi:Avidin family